MTLCDGEQAADPLGLPAEAVLAAPGTVPLTTHWSWSGATVDSEDILVPAPAVRAARWSAAMSGRAATFVACVLPKCRLAGIDIVVDATGYADAQLRHHPPSDACGHACGLIFFLLTNAAVGRRYDERDAPTVTVAVNTPEGTMVCVAEWDLAQGL